MTTYYGHKNWNYWNVSLWLGNDEGLYREALEYMRRYPNKSEAAAQMLADLKSRGVTKTPDGAPYSKSAILAAMEGLE